MKKIILFLIGVKIFTLAACEHETKPNREKSDGMTPYLKKELNYNSHFLLTDEDSKEVSEIKERFNSNLEAFKAYSFVNGFRGSESVRITLVFPLSPPVQLILVDNEFTYIELDKRVASSNFESSFVQKEYKIQNEVTFQSTIKTGSIIKNILSHDFCNDFSDFDSDLGFDASFALLETCNESGFCQIGFICSRARLRDFYPNEVLGLFINALPEDLVQSREQLKEYNR